MRRIGAPNATKIALKARPAAAPMTTACRASASARAKSPAPSARLIAEETPPPIAPADSICISMISGKTSVMAASGVVPRMPTYTVSKIATIARTSVAARLGRVSRSRAGRIGPETRAFPARAAKGRQFLAAALTAPLPAEVRVSSAMPLAGADPWPELNPDLDAQALAQRYAAAGRIHIPNVLTVPSAERLFQALERETPWKVTYNTGKESVELGSISAEERQKQIFAAWDRARADDRAP